MKQIEATRRLLWVLISVENFKKKKKNIESWVGKTEILKRELCWRTIYTL